MRWRHAFYAVCVIGLAIAVWTDRAPLDSGIVGPAEKVPRSDNAAPRTSPATSSPSPATRPEQQVLVLQPRDGLIGRAQDHAATSAFGSHSWAPPAVPASAADAGPAAPPALPFAYVGKQSVNGEWQVFLAQGDDLRIVKRSDVIADQYMVLSIDASVMTLDYLPLHAKQLLSLE